MEKLFLAAGTALIILSGAAFLNGCTQAETALQQAGVTTTCPPVYFTSAALVFPLNAEHNEAAVRICAGPGVSAAKLQHAAHVSALWLDNDEDGTLDNPSIAKRLNTHQAMLFLLADEDEEDVLLSAMSDIYTFTELLALNDQVLYATETAPGNGERDASGEEIHHLITDYGWFPDSAFSNALSNAYAEATSAPTKWFYDDPTCKLTCQYIEFLYTAVAAYLGSSPDLQAGELIIPEAERQPSASQSWLENNIPLTHELIDTTSGYPRIRWPDGRYSGGAENIISTTPY